ncbi:MAG: hypothetical protein Q4D13_02295 [Erysipelotrichaceae bacterium]|nr:hypothetical protein [Erysipelotrichaceae bacterium]
MLTRKEAINIYGSDYQLKKQLQNKSLYQIDKGIYSQKENVPDLAVISFRYPKSVITMNSAFYFYGLTDVIPDDYDVATDRNAPKISDGKIHQHFIPEDFLNDGAEEIDLNGYPIRIYSMERMLIELLRFKSKLPYDYYKEVLHSFRKKLPSMNIQKIQDYAMNAPNSNKVSERLQTEIL